MTIEKTSTSNNISAINEWFDNFIDHIRVDHFMLQTDSAPKETVDFYEAMISGDDTKVISTLRNTSTEYFVKKLVFDYLNELKIRNSNPLKLALGLSDSKILVWSEINDDDDSTEDALIIAEAKVNGKYHQHGFYLVSTIIEKSDNLNIPPHYKTIIN